jgi:TPP-dependent pyruvate/acetoin dehydrogenase alpha subunit
LEVFEKAVALARETKTPQMVVGKLLRLAGHGEHDDASYIDPKLREEASGRDPISVARAYLLASKEATEADLEAWQQDATEQVSNAISQAQNEPSPSSVGEAWEALASSHLVEGRSER